MRTILALAVALVLGTAPLAAQQSATATEVAQPAALPVAADARLTVAPEQVTKSLETTKAARADAVGSRSWLYLVAAIAAGVIIAALIL